MKKEEYSLVYKAIHGDSHAYGELIHQYNPYFYKIAFLYVKNEDAAVEIVQGQRLSGISENKDTEKSGAVFNMDDQNHYE